MDVAAGDNKVIVYGSDFLKENWRTEVGSDFSKKNWRTQMRHGDVSGRGVPNATRTR